MRRGLMKDLANTPTQIAIGWRLVGDVIRLSSMEGSTITIDLLSGDCRCDGRDLAPPLFVTGDVVDWMNERRAKDQVPDGMIESAVLTLRPTNDGDYVVVECSTTLVTEHGTFDSRGTTRWHRTDGEPPRGLKQRSVHLWRSLCGYLASQTR